MDGQVFLSWNIANWITVVLMVALGYLLATLLIQFVFARQQGGAQPGSLASQIGL